MSDAIQVISGGVLIVVGASLLWLALPRQGEVRHWLRGGQLQAYFTITVIGLLVLGLINLGVGLADLID